MIGRIARGRYTGVVNVGLPSGQIRGRNVKTSERVARELATYIIDARLPEGAVLPVEREMLETLSISRATLREALRLLESWGLVEVRPGPKGGPVVRKPRVGELSRALTLLLQC